MDAKVGVFRTGDDLATALETIRELRDRAQQAPVADKSRVYNSNLIHALELENLVDLAEVTVAGALARQESRARTRGATSRRATTRAGSSTRSPSTRRRPRFEYKPVTIDVWRPVERTY